MNRSHTLTHAHVISNARTVAWKPHSIFQSGWLFDQLLIAKITLSGCGYVKPHPSTCPHVFNNAYPGSWRAYAKFWLFGPSVLL